MTIGKGFNRILLVVLALLLCVSLASCGALNKSDKYDGIFSGEESDWNAEHEYATYAVILPSNTTAAVYNAAVEIAAKLSENTGAYAECFYAHENIPVGDDVCRIFIGNTGFFESSKYLQGFRASDIGYKYHGGCVYVGGITEESLLRAIEKFSDEVVVYTDREFFMNENTSVFVRGEYAIDEIKVAGFSLGEYTLVYPKGNAKLRDIAKDFSAKMLEETGYLLSVFSDEDLTVKSRVILLGDCDAFEELKITAELDKAKIVGFDSGVMIASAQPTAIAAALDMLGDKLLAADDNGKVDVNIDEPIEIRFDTTELSVLSFSTDSYALSRSVMLSMIEEIRESYPDIIRFERVSADSVESLLYNFNDKYALVALPNDTYHFIRKDRYEYAADGESDAYNVTYTHISRSAELYVLELGDLTSDALDVLNSALAEWGALLVFSDTEISGVDGVRSASALFEVNHTGGIDTPYFAGDTLAPVSYTVTETTGYTFGYTQVKIISFN